MLYFEKITYKYATWIQEVIVQITVEVSTESACCIEERFLQIYIDSIHTIPVYLKSKVSFQDLFVLKGNGNAKYHGLQ